GVPPDGPPVIGWRRGVIDRGRPEVPKRTVRAGLREARDDAGRRGRKGDAMGKRRAPVVRKAARQRTGRLSRPELVVGAGAAAGGGIAAGWFPQVLIPAATAAAETPKRGGKVTWGFLNDPVAMIPFGATNGSNFDCTSLMYESLLKWDRKLNIRP